MTSCRRFLAFNIVGLGGVVVQLLSLSAFVAMHVHYMPATAAAVALSVVHNFVWHRVWTWRDRGGAMFARFVVTNGGVSLAGNLGVMLTLVSGAGVPPVAANFVAIGVCGLLNFWLGDAFVFTRN